VAFSLAPTSFTAAMYSWYSWPLSNEEKFLKIFQEFQKFPRISEFIKGNIKNWDPLFHVIV